MCWKLGIDGLHGDEVSVNEPWTKITRISSQQCLEIEGPGVRGAFEEYPLLFRWVSESIKVRYNSVQLRREKDWLTGS